MDDEARSIGAGSPSRLLAGLGWLIAKLPPAVLRVLGACIGFLAGSLLRIRRAHVEQAMEAGGIRHPRSSARAMYRSLGTSLFEFLWLAGGDAARLDACVRMDERSRRALAEARALGRGIVLAATHTGNWDLAACAMAREGPLLVVTKRLSLRALDHFWQSTRRGYGVRLCEAKGAMNEGRRMLRAGGAVAMMIDQVPVRWQHAVTVSFFGRPAHTDKAPAALAASAGAPLVVAGACRGPEGLHHLCVLDVLFPGEHARRAWIEEATRRSTYALERFVREHPSEWLWLHRRWKRLPKHPPGAPREPIAEGPRM
ncbi:lysophospholipid acyltransferase family protein [Pendulispora albinea]|uniref:Lysophospholipid acyltransferase family protein n=1 Tax=Pendulispora albinea TaxID=2741071 RepID=A0ABZ2LK61_9BACT